MGERVILVYHRPGSPEGRSLVHRLAGLVERLTGASVGTVTLEELGRRGVQASAAFLLLTARGGHYAEARKALAARGVKVAGPIPPWLVALHLSKSLEGCSSRVVIEYMPARRLAEERARDYDAIARITSRLTGLEVEARPAGSGSGDGCVVTVSLTPSRLLSRGGARNVPLLPSSTDLLASWVAASLEGLLDRS